MTATCPSNSHWHGGAFLSRENCNSLVGRQQDGYGWLLLFMTDSQPIDPTWKSQTPDPNQTPDARKNLSYWDYLYLFVGFFVFSSIAILWGLQGEIMLDSRTISDEHIDWDARAHKREELRFCLMQEFVFFPDSRLWHSHVPYLVLQMVDPTKAGRFVLVSPTKAVTSALFWSV